MNEVQLPLHPIARIHGEPLLEMPQDLYIPPDALELVLENFQGPLDLLLYLIRKHNLDVLDIPMAELTRQYMGYIEMMQQHRLELAAEYLLMAAVLIEIKSRMLLPRPPKASEAEVEDPRAELMRRLLEYEQMKLAAQKLNELPQAGRDFEIVQVLIERTVKERLPQVSVEDLRQAWLGVLARAKLHTHHKVRREQLSVREQMTHVLRCLQGGEYVAFDRLFDTRHGVAKLVVTFIAILELAKEYLVEIQQSETLGSIYVRTSRAITAE
ncbi:MAG: segregation and condensation protein A [Gallionellales bacterium RIFCSPLOWO2_12_FULL_59_22]|nr:MAG: segregation and condensation protein A [Gallionellales bacterium RIFCSPLOWO2_02_FULL_59_110]OGT01914.1 MAG: segregation and condensation protein A [Gallionellales bacterium RIFCSPLOWO2_02_58_13]OGT13581.1 MAG: segregation and condensation protein A [Gallionellales bacterium RIFCSPLOWO2_12_FULL_59_22]